MFFVKYGNEYIHDPRKDLFLTAANPEVELNASGSFTFTMQYNNPLYDKLVERDTKNPITVWQDDELIFIGDIINIESGFKKYKEVECRGILGWLNDSIVRPYSTLESENDNVAPDGIAGYFEWLINNHNSQVEDTKKFKIDKNEGQSLDSKIYRSDSSYTNTGELIKNKILDEVGGYVIPKEENGEHVIDLIREMPEDNSQLIDFGKNLLDYVSSEDTDGMYTFVIPTGVMAEKESDNSEKATHNITIGERTVTDLTRAMENRKVEHEEAQNNSSTTEEDLKAAEEAYESAKAALEDAKVYTLDGIVEEGYFKQGDIIYSEAAVKEHGWIGCTVAFDNTTLVSELIRNGILALKGMESPVRTIEVKAVDLSMIKPNYSPIRVGQYVRVRSKPHDFDSYMLCSKISYDLNQPDQNTFTLGQTYDVLTGIQNKKIKALNESVNHVYSSAERISDEAKAIADATKKNEEEINNVREALLNIDGLYMHLRYSANADGSDMTEYPELNTIYIGIYSGNQKEAPTEKEMYTWSRFKGEEGQSVKGDDGANAYLHIKYSNDGETFTSNNGETPGYWMGTYTDHNETDSMIFDDYSWAKIKGEKGDTGPQGLQGIQGEKGEQGVPGTPGDSGKTTYFHIKYSAYSKPTANQMSELPNTYIGTYVDFTKEDSTNPDDYTWFRIKGEDGIPGIGVDGKTSYLHIKYSNDGSTFTANNGETPGEWIGTYTDHTEADSINFSDYTWIKIKGEKGDQGIQGLQGPKGDQGIKGDPGQNGVSTYFHIAYANSADGKTDFSVSDPSGRDYIGTYVDSNPTDSTNYVSYSWQLVKGSQGPKGDQGIAGTKGADGKTTYLHIAYATSSDGSTGFSVGDSANKTYIGQYTDYTESDSTDPTKYKWTLIKGATGATGPQGPKGDQGIQGLQGPKGDKGNTGATGATGPQGPQGEKGNTGATGPQGPQGNKGDKGDKGDTGPQGAQGPQGDPGKDGLNGTNLWINPTFDSDKPLLGKLETSIKAPNGSNVCLLEARDHFKGDTSFPVFPGHKYRIKVHRKRAYGTLQLRAGIWYTEYVSGAPWDGHVSPRLVTTLSDGWEEAIYDFICPDGKSKGCIFLQIEQFAGSITTAWYISNLICFDITDIDEAGKTATNFMDFVEGEGLIIGDRRNGTVSNNVLIDSDSVDIRSGNTVLASFSAETDSYGNVRSDVLTPGSSRFGTVTNYGTELFAYGTTSNETYKYSDGTVTSCVKIVTNAHDATLASGNSSIAKLELHSESGYLSYINVDADIINFKCDAYDIQNADKFRSAISAAASSHTHNINTLDVKSYNPITSTANDTTANWAKHGNSIHWYSTGGCLIDQPYQYGILLNNVCGSDVRQIFFAQPGGNMYHRGGNDSGWSGSWKALLDSSNLTLWAAAKSHTHTPGDISGVLPISAGGTGYGSISSSSTITDYMSLNTTNTSAITGKVVRWGPVLQFDITFTLKNSLAAGNITNATLGTFKSAYRPKISFGCCSSDTGGLASFTINTSGDLIVCATHAAFARGDKISASGMYLLA